MRRSYIHVIIVFIGIAFILGYLLAPPNFDSPEQKLEFSLEQDLPGMSKQAYMKLVEKDSFNIEYHHGYILFHFELPYRGNYKEFSNNEEIIQFYLLKTLSPNQQMRDIGNFGTGLCYTFLGNYVKALNYFFSVKNSRLKYLNNSIGYCFFQLGEEENGDIYMHKEIEVGGDLPSAYQNLASMHYENGQYSLINELLNNKETRQYVPSDIKRHLYLKRFNLLRYFQSVFLITYQNLDFTSFLAALMIVLVYLIYLRKIDIYEPEKWKYILLIFLGGAFFSEFTFLLSDVLKYFAGFNLNGEVMNDLFYSVIGIGMVEELVKIIPLLFLLKFTGEVNEPVDFIVYASISALGFAFSENLMYFKNLGESVIIGRTLTSVVFHMFLSSLVAYGMVVAKFKEKRNVFEKFFFFFLIASLLHGLYDFWLVNDKVHNFHFLSVMLFILCLTIYNTLISNSLSNSSFYDSNILLNVKKLQDVLIYSISGILLFQFIAISFKYGAAHGRASLVHSIYSGFYLIMFVTSGLGDIKIRRGVWKPFSLGIPAFSLNFEEDEQDVVGEYFDLSPFTKTNATVPFLPNRGIIMYRDEFSGYNNWYFLKLDREVKTGECGSYLLVRPRFKEKDIHSLEKNIVGVYVLPNCKMVHEKEKKRKDFIFKGCAIMEQNEI